MMDTWTARARIAAAAIRMSRHGSIPTRFGAPILSLSDSGFILRMRHQTREILAALAPGVPRADAYAWLRSHVRC